VFWTFRVMVGLGVLMIALGLWGLWLRRGDRLYRSRPFLCFALALGPAGLVAILAGWLTTEIGRQPWVIHGLMRTADAVSAHSASQVGLTLAAFVIVYLAVFGAGTAYLLRLIGMGPTSPAINPRSRGGRTRLAGRCGPFGGRYRRRPRGPAGRAAGALDGHRPAAALGRHHRVRHHDVPS
jgi:cytochrome d ubiquinol oxidase subunit I